MSPLIYFTNLFGVVIPDGIIITLFILFAVNSIIELISTFNNQKKGDSAMTNKTKKNASIIFNVVRIVPKVGGLGMTFRKEGCLSMAH